ncbi:iron ABC transporter permease [Eikenella sp. S3360]|uniref:Iron ABC transporter permease n=1 Tax=Eikenella glucosivorans TaxID=2766967 RepID=A0ABS0N850_9NEIS|nr:iron ABC transporter permease [Eikenella glucosivorans]MBH5328482.1 iron ABC transporter permease [Eikenella glucosivorans]
MPAPRPARFSGYPLLMLALSAVLLLAVLFSLSWGRYPVPVDAVWRSLLQGAAQWAADWHLPFAGSLTPAPVGEVEANIVLNLRLPRILAAMLVGAALAASGAAYQGIFRNPLVSPDLLGVSSGACVGAALSILLGWSIWGTQAAAFAGGLLAVMMTLVLPRLVGRDSAVILVLAGIVVSGFMSATLGLMKYLADPETELAEIVYWQLGSLAKSEYGNLAALAPVMLLSAAVLVAMRWRINVLSLGDREARLVGAEIRRERTVMVVCATLLTASAVCLSGTIGWLGLVVPHLARLSAGDNNLRTLPLSILAGALFLLCTDTLARNLYEQEIPLGIITGFIGAPFFAWVLVRQKVAD